MNLKRKEGKDLADYEVGKRIIERPIRKLAKLNMHPQDRNFEMFRIRLKEKN
jgi:hypothetical protein